MERKAIYVTRQGARVHLADGQVAVSVDRAIVERWPPEVVDRLLLFGNVQITTQILAILFRHGVTVAFLSSSGRYRGQLVPPESGNVFLRLAQHARYADREFRLAVARDLVRDKIREGRTQVRRFARNHPETDAVMDAVARRMTEGLGQVDRAVDDESLRGVEGAAAAACFEAFGRMVRPPFTFERRSKHPARDAVNALLNLGYVLLAGEIAGRLESAGFDPRVGYYHGVRYGRASLALDLLEVHRVTVVDRLVLSLLNRRVFSPADCEDHGGTAGVRLRPAALRRYLALWETALGEQAPSGETPRARIHAQVSALRRAVMAGRPPRVESGDPGLPAPAAAAG